MTVKRVRVAVGAGEVVGVLHPAPGWPGPDALDRREAMEPRRRWLARYLTTEA